MKLYTVTTYAGNVQHEVFRHGKIPEITSTSRTVCVADNLETAREVVESNRWDIYEDEYRYAIIEEITANAMYGGSNYLKAWYEWKDGKYVETAVPEQYRHILGWWG